MNPFFRPDPSGLALPLERDSQTHPEVCFTNLLGGSVAGANQVDNQNYPLFLGKYPECLV